MKEALAHCDNCFNENCFIKKHLHLEQMKRFMDKKIVLYAKNRISLLLKEHLHKGFILLKKEK